MSRVVPKGTIVTRNRSAQQKRKLREKDRSMTNFTQLLKSPTKIKTYPGKKKQQKSPNTDKEKKLLEPNIVVLDDERKEYYPNKLKRKFEEKRVFLKPKYQSKTVVKLNKRKLGTPQKGMLPEDLISNSGHNQDWLSYKQHQIKSDSLQYSELSMDEVIRIVEDTESLDDEDLMEILTCPSPVWWEDPPGDMYIEESIDTRPESPVKENNSPDNREKTREKAQIENNVIENIVQKDKIQNKGEKFLKKQNKLENLLGSIKNKVLHKDKEVDLNLVNETTNVNEQNEENMDKVQRKRYESDGDLSDNIIDDEMLNDLENMPIPIEDSSILRTVLSDDKYEDDKALIPSNRDINVSNTCGVPDRLPPLTKRPKEFDHNNDNRRNIDNTDSISDTNIKFITEDTSSNIAEAKNREMPKLVKGVKIENDSRKDAKIIKSEYDDTETTDSFNESKNMEMPKLVKGGRIEIKAEKQDNDNNNVIDNINNIDKELITIYKIVDDRPSHSKFKNIPEYSSHVENLIKQETKEDKGLNSFYKKCKNANRKRCKKEDRERGNDVSNKDELCRDCEPKSITVAQEENVKYCLKCSSIFDTEQCSYCLKSQIEKCDSDLATIVKINSEKDVH